jgi:hypothetical protein
VKVRDQDRQRSSGLREADHFGVAEVVRSAVTKDPSDRNPDHSYMD